MSTADTAGGGFELRTESLTGRHWLAIVLAAVTGAIHLWLGVSFISSPLGWSFLIAGIGFLAGTAAVLVDYRRPLVYLLGVPFTLGQVVAWYLVNAPDFSTVGYVDKAVQLALVAVLAYLYGRES
ncbi:hypothetical protein BRC83_02215 [Halobacteriales archaeon QS_1_68_17]|nr:MAG: hypothetical protein BRC83_02215 [Halobacteriales archaeon QS_1_68_17]